METPELPKKSTPEEIERQKQNLEQQPTKEDPIKEDPVVRLSEINEDITKKETSISDTQTKLDAVRDELKLPPSSEVPPSIKNDQEAVEKLKEEKEQLRDALRKDILNLIVELGPQEVFPFPNMDPEAYRQAKESEEYLANTDYQLTPIDEVIKKMKVHGVKLMVGKNYEKAEVFIVPANTSEITDDCIKINQIELSSITNPKVASIAEKSITLNNIRTRA